MNSASVISNGVLTSGVSQTGLTVGMAGNAVLTSPTACVDLASIPPAILAADPNGPEDLSEAMRTAALLLGNVRGGRGVGSRLETLTNPSPRPGKQPFFGRSGSPDESLSALRTAGELLGPISPSDFERLVRRTVEQHGISVAVSSARSLLDIARRRLGGSVRPILEGELRRLAGIQNIDYRSLSESERNFLEQLGWIWIEAERIAVDSVGTGPLVEAVRPLYGDRMGTEATTLGVAGILGIDGQYLIGETWRPMPVRTEPPRYTIEYGQQLGIQRPNPYNEATSVARTNYSVGSSPRFETSRVINNAVREVYPHMLFSTRAITGETGSRYPFPETAEIETMVGHVKDLSGKEPELHYVVVAVPAVKRAGADWEFFFTWDPALAPPGSWDHGKRFLLSPKGPVPLENERLYNNCIFFVPRSNPKNGFVLDEKGNNIFGYVFLPTEARRRPAMGIPVNPHHNPNLLPRLGHDDEVVGPSGMTAKEETVIKRMRIYLPGKENSPPAPDTLVGAPQLWIVKIHPLS